MNAGYEILYIFENLMNVNSPNVHLAIDIYETCTTFQIYIFNGIKLNVFQFEQNLLICVGLPV